MSKIYTKTGDGGLTSLLGGTKVPKNDWRLEAYGTVDELNSFLGLLADKVLDSRKGLLQEYDNLKIIQHNLFTIGSQLSYDNSGKLKITLPEIEEKHILQLETWIDEMEETLEPLKNFIIPGGDQMISTCHICRTISRRAERNCVPAIQYPLILKYLNRLSDFLFVLSRSISKKIRAEEELWKKN